MTKPNVTIAVEPGDGSNVFYQILAKETVSAITNCKIGLVLDITNNESFDIKISVNPAFVMFPNIPQISPIGGTLLIPSGGKYVLGMTGGPHNGGAAQDIVRPSPPPAEVSIVLQFDDFDGIEITRALMPYSSPIAYSGYRFPGKSEDLSYGEFWKSPGYHGYGGNQIFAHDLSVIAWNSIEGKYSRLAYRTNGSKNEDYLIWEKPVYAMASGEIISFDNEINDYPFPGTGFPDPQFFNNKYCGNGFRIKHSTDLLSYCHMRKGSLNPDLLHNNAIVNEGDFLGLAGNSGNSSEPHLHIDAVNITTGRLRPLLFRDVQVLSLSALTADPDSTWVMANGQGLPSVETAIWPSATPIPKLTSQIDLSKWKAISEIIFGIIGDGGGLVVTPKGKRLPPPPPDPLRMLPIKKDFLLGLALTELTTVATSNESKKSIQEAGTNVMEKAIIKMKKEFKGLNLE